MILVSVVSTLGLGTGDGRGGQQPQQHVPLVTALGSGPLGPTSAAIACFRAAHLCMELHHHLSTSLPPGAAPLRQEPSPCSFAGCLSGVVSASKRERYWKIHASVTRLARKLCRGVRSVRCVWVCVLRGCHPAGSVLHSLPGCWIYFDAGMDLTLGNICH